MTAAATAVATVGGEYRMAMAVAAEATVMVVAEVAEVVAIVVAMVVMVVREAEARSCTG